MEHFHNPRNLGALVHPDGLARLENPVCGDVAELSLRLDQGRVAEVGWRVSGCVAAVAASSLLGELVCERSLEEAARIGVPELIEALGGLPASKKHAASLAVRVLREALATAGYDRGES